MGLLGLILLMLLNGGISFLNALGCAYSDAETKAVGGWQRFVWWCTWIMSGLGFGSCYLLLVATIGVGAGLISAPNLSFILSLWYVLCAPAFVGVGLAITVDQWARTFREGGVLNWGVSMWNTYAQIHNTMSMVENFGEAFGEVMKGLGKAADGEDGWKVVIGVLVVMFTIGLGFITTWLIVHRFSAAHALPDREELQRKRGITD